MESELCDVETALESDWLITVASVVLSLVSVMFLVLVPSVDISTVDFSSFGDVVVFIVGEMVVALDVVDSGMFADGVSGFCSALEILDRRRQKMVP